MSPLCEASGKVWRNMRRFLRRFGFPILMTLAMIGWGIFTGWWNMAGLSIVIIASLTALIGTRGRFRKTILIVCAMLPVIGKKIDALKDFQRKADEKVIQEVRKEESYVIYLNTDEQLFRGLDGEGNKIRPPYKPFTVRVKLRKGQPVNRVTLLDTGDFYGGTDVLYGQDEFRIINLDEKADKLRAKYGDAILGLNEQSRDLLAQKIKPGLINQFQKRLANV